MIVAGTGHRPDKLGGYSKEAFNKLVSIATNYLIENEPMLVISGMALGWDIALAQAAINLNLQLECAIPFHGQDLVGTEDSKRLYHKIIDKANKITFVCQGAYAPYKMQVRNEYMVNSCSILLAMWNGSNGGTANCINYAKTKENIQIINLYSKF